MVKIICPCCKQKNKNTALFCRNCFILLDPFPEDPSYINENFDKLRDTVLKFFHRKISQKKYHESLSKFEKEIEESLNQAEILKKEITRDKIEKEVRLQKQLVKDGLSGYMKALEVLAFTLSSQNKKTFIKGLSLAEKSNHKLNKAIKIIEEQEEAIKSIFGKRLEK